jgi:hypothetical protein
MNQGKLAALLILFFLAVPAGAQEVPGWVQQTSISGLFFGDYFYAASHHDSEIEGANGFQARRMYLNVNTRFNPSWDARVRFEAASPGAFDSSSRMEPFLKDLWVRWRKGNHSITIGLSSTPTWNVTEGEWGYRDLEKTPLDLYKYGSSRDFGVSFRGSFDEDRKVRYHLMVGNGSGTKGETNEGKKVAGSLTFYPNSNVVLEVEAEREGRPDDEDRTTFTGFAVVKGDQGRVGVMAARHSRGMSDEDDLDMDVFSIFGVLNASEKVNLIARWDSMLDPVPDGAGISYFAMDPTSKGNFFLAGVDIALNDNVHLIPNLEMVTYDESDIDSDVFLKTTFSITF